jgi:hypothetical protein
MFSACTSQTPTEGTSGDDMPGSTDSKRKSFSTDNFEDFVKDFNYDYLACAEVQERDKRA